MIRAVISDFGGVLTTPLAGSFKAFAERSGIPLEALGERLEGTRQRRRQHTAEVADDRADHRLGRLPLVRRSTS